MNIKWVVFCGCMFISGQSIAANELYRIGVAPTVRKNEGQYYDQKYGCKVQYRKEQDGTVQYKGIFPDGSLTFVTLKKNGDMHGIDVDGAYWTYERKTGLVHDFMRDRVFFWDKKDR